MVSARFRAVAASAPKNYVDSAYFATFFGDDAGRIDRAAGLDRRPRLLPNAQPIDLALSACRAVMSFSGVDPASIDALIYVTQSPEYKIPATACIIQDRLELPNTTAALDVNLGCSGYVYGLFQAVALIRAGLRKRILLVIGDAGGSRINDPNDRATAPIFGDGMAATIIEASDGPDSFGPFVLGTDGKGWSNLCVPVGYHAFLDVEAFERKRPPEFADVKDPRSLHMKGEEIFSFTLSHVPPLVTSLLAEAKMTIEQVDSFILHQANMFMLETIRRKLKIPAAKMPYSIKEYANTSGASVPFTLCHAFKGQEKRMVEAALVGFGIGYSWGATLLHLDTATVGPIVEFE